MPDYDALALARAPQPLTGQPDDDANPYLPIARDQQVLQQNKARTVLESAFKTTPDVAAEHARLSASSGLPIQVVERNAEQVRVAERARAVDLMNIAAESPVLYRQLTDPTFTSSSSDDLDTLKNIERSIGKGVAYVMGATPDGGLPSDAVGGAKSLALGATVGIGKMAFDVAGVVNDLIGWQGGAASARTAARRAQESMNEFGMQTESSTGAAVKSGLESAGTNLALLPAGLSRGLFQTANQAASVVAGLMATGVGASAYSEARDQGRTVVQAGAYAIPQAAFEYVFERIPASKLFGDMEANTGLFKMLGKQAISEGWTEQVTTLAQDFNEWMNLNPNKTLGEFVQERPEAAYQTFIATLVGVGVQTSAIKGINKIVERASNQNLVFEQDQLDRQMQLAATSMLRQRSPEQFRTHMQAVMDENPEAKQNVFIDAEVLNQMPPEVLAGLSQSVREQIPGALETRSPVAIPMADILTVAPGTPLEQALNQNARMTPDAPSKAEAELTQQYMQQEAERVLQQAADTDAWTAGADQVKTTLLDQLNTTGRFTPDVNEAYATLVRDFYAVQANRLGLMPQEMYERYPLRVTAARSAAAGEVLSQQGATLDDVRGDLDAAGIKNAVFERNGQITVSQIVVPEDERGGGKGTAAMQALVAYADSTGQRVALSPSADFGGNKKRLVDFYKRFGFVENKGKNKDFEVSETMYRPAQTLQQGDVTASEARPTGKISPITRKPLFELYDSKGERIGLSHSYDTADEAVAGFNRPKLNESPPTPTYSIPEKDAPARSNWKQTKGQKFTALDDNDDYLYHVTAAPNAAGIRETGLAPGGGQTFGGAYSGYSAGKVFVTERSGVSFWKSRIEDQLFHTNDNPPKAVVMRVPKSAITAKLEPDEIGTADARADAYYSTETLKQGPRGSFSPSQLMIAIGENSDLSTFLHESGHFFLEVMADVASQPNAPAQIQDDMAATLKWFGVPDLATWNAMTLDEQRQHHERWAEAFEQYLLEGKAPNAELQPVFRRFRSWMVSVYKSLTEFMRARNLRVSDDIRQVFDRLVATDQQIAEAEETASMLPEFDATNEAIEQLQSRSMRNLKWAVNARNKKIKELQAQAKELRKEIKDEVTAEVNASPEVRAKAALDDLRKSTPEYKANLADWTRLRAEALETAKSDVTVNLLATEGAGLAGLKKAQFISKNKRRIANEAEGRALDWERLHAKPERTIMGDETDMALVADQTGFASVDEMLQAIDAYGRKADVIEGMTDQRMLERHGDLVDQNAIEAAATDAVHNASRARALAAELKAQDDAMNPRAQTGVASNGRAVTVNALERASNEFAKNLASRRRVKDLKSATQSHRAAEARAGKAWQKATVEGKTAEAIQHKRDQLLNNQTVRALLEAQTETRKILEFFRNVTKGSNEKTVERGRDPDVVNAMRAILGAYDVAPRGEKSANDYMAAVARNDPMMYAALQPSVQTALNAAQPMPQMTMEELRGLNDELRSMWDLAKRSRQMEVAGDLMDIDEAADDLVARMAEIGIPDEIPGERQAISPREELGIKMQYAKAILSRVEQWAERMDGKYGGPFLKTVFQPIKDAADRYRTDKATYRGRFTNLVDQVAPALPPGPIKAPELNYTFGAARDSGVAELLHAILHTGNESNKRKLLLGRGWATENTDGTVDTGRWDAFMQRMYSEGKITKAHFDFAQGVWDLLEEMKPLAQETHRKVFGRYFDEVTADQVDTPFGQYRGGYVPAQTDPRLVGDAKLRELAEGENESMAYAFPSSPSGFTKARVEYNKPLLLDIRALAQHMDKVLLFSHMQGAVNDVRRLLSRGNVSYALDRLQPGAYEGMLIPWLNRAAKQVVETPIMGDRKISRFLAAARGRAGLALMMGNLSNTVQQITGFSAAAVKVRPSLLMSALADSVAHPVRTRTNVAEASPFMKDRMLNEVSAMTDIVDEIMMDQSVYEKAQAWTARHGYFLQAAVDNFMSPIVWTGAYNQAIEQGQDHDDAVRFADGTVRQTQGTTLPEDISRIESGNAIARFFTQFIGYFNMMANTNATAMVQISQDMGLRKGAGKLLYVAIAGLLAPIWVAEAIAIAFRGGPEDKDRDGYLDDWLAAVFGLGTIKGLLATVPIAGQGGQVILNRFNDNPADDKFSLSPAVSLLESTVSAPFDVYKAIEGEGNVQKAVRSTFTAASMVTGLPFFMLSRPVGYLAGVEQGRIQPTGAMDATRGMITGTASPESKVK